MSNPDVTYLPGDRVINEAYGTATVCRPEDTARPDAAREYLSLRRDSNGTCDFWSFDGWKRQPIEPGCWVRSIHPGKEHIQHKIVGFDGIGRPISHKGHTLIADCFVRIEAPKPVCAGIDIASGPDRTTLTTIYHNDPAHLKLAQQLATSLHSRHFSEYPAPKIGNDLPAALIQIDSMTSNMVTHSVLNSEIQKRERLAEQIEKLSEFIMHSVDGEPSQSESAVDCAIRIIRSQQDAMVEAGKLFRAYTDGFPHIVEWLEKYAPPPKPTFNRGQHVVWMRTNMVPVTGRIVNFDKCPEGFCEIMSKDGLFYVAGMSEIIPSP